VASISTRGAHSTPISGYVKRHTLKGYDNMTGLGTPNGQYFIKALRTPGKL
jgi:hypothetical protein